MASAGEDGTVKLWQTEDGHLLQTFEGHQSKVYSVAVSPDGQTISSAGRDGTIKFWALDGRLIATLPTQQEVISEVTFSPDGQWLASGGWDNTVALWHLENAVLLDQVERLGCTWLWHYLQTHSEVQRNTALCKLLAVK
jgi:WD40 repeat protein